MVNLIETSVSLDALREYARKELVDLLNEVSEPEIVLCYCITFFCCLPQMRGGKVLVIDPQFAGPLGLITEIQLLKACPFPCILIFYPSFLCRPYKAVSGFEKFDKTTFHTVVLYQYYHHKRLTNAY